MKKPIVSIRGKNSEFVLMFYLENIDYLHTDVVSMDRVKIASKEKEVHIPTNKIKSYNISSMLSNLIEKSNNVFNFMGGGNPPDYIQIIDKNSVEKVKLTNREKSELNKLDEKIKLFKNQEKI